jgi:hypothetical protein
VKWGPHSRNESIYGHPSVRLGTFQTHPDARQCIECSGVAYVEFVTQNILITVNLHYYYYYYYYYRYCYNNNNNRRHHHHHLRNVIFFLFELCVQYVVYVSIISAEKDTVKWSKTLLCIFHEAGSLYSQDTPHSVGHLWTSDQSEAETFT